MPAYELRHVVGFEDTNLLGNVYYVNFIRWQGRCREMFLRDHAPSVLGEMDRGLVLATTRCSCEFLRELRPFDEVAVRMRFGGAVQNRLVMFFDYVHLRADGELPVARGEQEIAFLRRDEGRLTPAPIPDELLRSARTFDGAAS